MNRKRSTLPVARTLISPLLRIARALGLTTFLLVLACATAPLDPVEPPSEEALSILLIGNSLTLANDLPEMVQGLLEEGTSGPVVVSSSSFPGYGLQDHWIDRRTRAFLAAGRWDYVVLQQGPSATEGRPSLLRYTDRFHREIEAMGAQTGLYMVWPSSQRRFDFAGVARSYAAAAKRVDGILFPVGEVWEAVWEKNPKAQLYGPDGFHPSVLGSYVAALTIADQIVGEKLNPSHVIKTASGPITIDPAFGDQLLEVVREVNDRFR